MAGGPVSNTRIRTDRRSSGQGTGGVGALRPRRLRASLVDGQVLFGGHRGQAQRQRGVADHVGAGHQNSLVLGHADVRVAGDRRDGAIGRLVLLGGRGGPEAPAGRALRSRPGASAAPGASSPSHATVRPAVATARINESESGSPTAAATWSCSWRSSLFCSWPARRWSSTRMVVSTRRASSMATVST